LPDCLKDGYTGGFSADGQTLAIATKTGQLSLWNIADKNPRLIRQFAARSGRIGAVQFSPDGQQLVEIGEGGTIQLWTIAGKPLAQLAGHGGSDLLALQFSPDGQQIATAARDGSVRIWSAKGTLLHNLQGDRFPVSHLSFSRDGQRIATGSSDGTARIWDRAGNLRIEYKGHQDALSALAFAPDGQQLTTVSRDGQVRFWSVEEEADRLQRLMTRGCQWLADYLQSNPPAQKRLPVCSSAKPKLETDGNVRDGRGENGRSPLN
jgi:WD40 repeat protein